MSTTHFAETSDGAFIADLLRYGEDYVPQPGDVLDFDGDDVKTTDGKPIKAKRAKVVGSSKRTLMLLLPRTKKEVEISTEGWFNVIESPGITALFEQHLRGAAPDGVAFADGLVDAALVGRLRADVQRLLELEPVDYHPGSGTRVRDLVHPSLYPYIAGRSVVQPAIPTSEAPRRDHFGREFESSRYQWLPTPFRISKKGEVTIDSYINNLDRIRHASTYDDLAKLFETALPLIESVVGYVDHTTFFVEGSEEIEHEGELPEKPRLKRKPAKPTSLRGRELLVIPKIVEYRLGAGETHEGVWHVEGMSHEHIVATCVYILDRDEALTGGELRFKRAYTVEEAGRLFWNVSQSRPRPIEKLVDEGTIPLGSVATPEGRLVVFPNSHIHKLSELAVKAGASAAHRRVIVFWVVDPGVRIPSTREVAPQQGVIPHKEALSIRLKLMEERKRHKQSLNVRVVSLCEH